MELIIAVLGTLFCLLGILGVTFAARHNYLKFVSEQKEVLNNVVSLVNERNAAVNNALSEYVSWLNNEFSQQCIEIFMSDSFLMALKEKYNIPDSEFVLAFQSVIADVQNANRVKTTEALTKVSASMLEAVKKQMGAENVSKV